MTTPHDFDKLYPQHRDRSAYSYIYKLLANDINALLDPVILSQSQTTEQTGTSSRGRKKYQYIRPEERHTASLYKPQENAAAHYIQNTYEPPPDETFFEAIDMETNPDHDIIATGAVELYKTASHCYVYRQDGRLAGILTKDKTIELWNRFQLATYTPWTEEITSLSPKPFADEILLLLDRYTKGERTDKDGNSPTKNHRTLPRDIYQTLKQCTDYDTERLASPLDVSPLSPYYYSCYKRDALFGAHHNAYSSVWTGCSLANPEYTPEAAHDAISWAVKSCSIEEDLPSLTIMFVPNWPDKKTNAWLKHPKVQVLTTIPRARLPFQFSNYSNMFSKSGRNYDDLDTHILLIGNNLGLTHYFSADTSASLALTMLKIGQTTKTIDHSNWVQAPFKTIARQTARHTVHLSSQFKRVLERTSIRQREIELHLRAHNPAFQPLHSAPLGQFTPFRPASERILKWDNQMIYYTDGSAKDGKTGAGIIVSNAIGSISNAISLPLGHGNSLTAELASIHHALSIHDRDSPILIANDCLVALRAISNGLQDPITVVNHREEVALRKCISAIKNARLRQLSSRLKVISAYGATQKQMKLPLQGEC